jgi:hypothetical protein
MTGQMTLQIEKERVTPSEEVLLQTALLEAIESGMENGIYIKGSVTKLAFIGSRSSLSTPTAVSEEASPTMKKSIRSGGNGGLGATEISLISVASILLVLLIAIALLLLARRSKKVKSANSPRNSPGRKVALDDDSENPETIGDGRSEWDNTSEKIRAAPPIARQYSLEGSEIPGSLAALDALALKPQFPRLNEPCFSSSADEGYGRSPPRTPPKINRDSRTNRPPPPPPPPRPQPIQSEGRSPDPEQEDQIKHSFSSASTQSEVPLSPVRNKKSGVSPSQVSPKRSANSDSHKLKSNGRNKAARSSPPFSVVEAMMTEIESGIRLENATPRQKKKAETIKNLQRIASSDSGDSSSSFHEP